MQECKDTVAASESNVDAQKAALATAEANLTTAKEAEIAELNEAVVLIQARLDILNS